jgi:hypothetical protein
VAAAVVSSSCWCYWKNSAERRRPSEAARFTSESSEVIRVSSYKDRDSGISKLGCGGVPPADRWGGGERRNPPLRVVTFEGVEDEASAKG